MDLKTRILALCLVAGSIPAAWALPGEDESPAALATVVKGSVGSGARATLAAAQTQYRLGNRRAALRLSRQAVREARQSGEPALQRAVATAAADIAAQAGDVERQFAFLKVAQEAADRLKTDALYPGGFQTGEIPAVAPLKETPVPPPRPLERPLDEFSQRLSVEAFLDRVEKDPNYVTQLKLLKEFREYHRAPHLETLEHPEVHVDEVKTWRHDYKTVASAYSYYRFALNLSKKVDDAYGLAVLYMNMTFFKEIDSPILRMSYYVAKAGAMAEAASRIIAFVPGAGEVPLAILAFDKVLIDIIRHQKKYKKQKRREEQDAQEDRTYDLFP